MLEVFFDNEKVFTFFRKLLENGEEMVNCFKILYELGIDTRDGAEILQSFVFLGILEETDRLEEGIFKINVVSPVLLKLCLFDEFVCNYCRQQVIKEGEKNNNLFEEFFGSLERDEDGISIKEISVENLDDLMDLFKENGLI